MAMRRSDVMFCLACVAMCGCGSQRTDQWTEARPKVYPASGIVQYNGEPLEGASVVLRSESEPRAAYGVSDASGEFKLTTFEQDDGAVAGMHQVRITKIETKEAPAPVDPEANVIPAEEVSLLPARYGDFTKSGLTAEVIPDGANRFEFMLQK